MTRRGGVAMEPRIVIDDALKEHLRAKKADAIAVDIIDCVS